MIPLERWLAAREGIDDALGTHEDLEVRIQPDVRDEPDVAVTPSRCQELEESLAAALREIEEQKTAAAVREQALADQLGEALVVRLKEQVEAGLASLQQALESAICDVLTPFLSGEAGRTAATRLLGLVTMAFRNSSEPLLEVRAPRHLHGPLSFAMEQLAISSTIVEASPVELVFADHRERFEELASAWVSIVAGAGDEP